MKRHGDLYEKVWSIDNLRIALQKARKGKKKQKSVRRFMEKEEENLLRLQNMIRDKTYKTSPYTTFTLVQEKVRLIHRLPFIDRVCHHAIANIITPIFYPIFTSHTYSCIPGRGIHKASYKFREALTNLNNNYVLKFDIKKYYPSVNHEILKNFVRKKIKDKDLLWLLDEIIESAKGLPIGNYLSQIFANLYLNGFDHFLKEEKKIQDCYRYMDDVVILAETKAELHSLFKEIETYLQNKLQLQIKPDWRVFPVELGTDFVGYVHFRTYVRLRPRIKRRFARMLAKKYRRASISGYKGWVSHCNGRHLMKTLLQSAS